MNIIRKVLTVIGAVAAVLAVLGIINKPSSVYKNQKEEQNPLEGKKVRFVENENEKMNADGVRGHLEAIGISSHKAGFYEKYIKRLLDIILSLGGLIILLPIFLIISLWIQIDDPGPILFTQKRMGKNKQYFKLHNVFKTASDPALCNKVPKNAA